MLEAEIARQTAQQKNWDNIHRIDQFLNAIHAGSFQTKIAWTPEETGKIKELSERVAGALPDSIKKIVFPNGGGMILGAEDDEVRIVNWDLDDVKRWAKHLKKTSRF